MVSPALFLSSSDSAKKDGGVRTRRPINPLTFPFLLAADEDFYRNDYPEEEDGASEDSYGDGIGSGGERWEEDY